MSIKVFPIYNTMDSTSYYFDKVDQYLFYISNCGFEVVSEVSDIALKNAQVCVAFFDKQLLQDPIALQFLNLCVQYDRAIIPIYLEDVTLPNQYLQQCNNARSIHVYRYPIHDRQKEFTREFKLLKKSFSSSSRKLSPLGLFFSLVALGGIFFGISRIVPLFFAKEPEVVVEVTPTPEVTSTYTDAIDAVGEAKVYGYIDGIYYSSIGTAFAITPDGYLLTNFHVVDYDPVDLIEFTYNDKVVSAELIATKEERDLALLKLDVPTPNYLQICKEDADVGEVVYAIGYPQGIDKVISNGIVSKKEHITSEGDKYSIISASISRGNSGGPCVNSNGEVIGIATAIYDTANNVNLMIPVSEFLPFVQEYITLP